MNIFVLDTNPETAAQMQCDKHIPKMILESAQMMVSALRRYGVTDEYLVDKGVVTKTGTPYKETHKNHPCTRWAGDSRYNYLWLGNHAMSLLDEYTHRYGKVHACRTPILRMWAMASIIERYTVNDELKMATPFPQCMPDEYKGDDTVVAYQKYYHSKTFAKWEKGRPAPDWWKGLTGTVI